MTVDQARAKWHELRQLPGCIQDRDNPKGELQIWISTAKIVDFRDSDISSKALSKDKAMRNPSEDQLRKAEHDLRSGMDNIFGLSRLLVACIAAQSHDSCWFECAGRQSLHAL